MIRDKIFDDLKEAIKKLTSQQEDKRLSIVEVIRSSDPKFGDYSTNLALKAIHPRGEKDLHPWGVEAKRKQSPMEIAKLLADSLQVLPYVKKLEVIEPGFINFFIKEEFWQKQVDVVLNKGAKYGSNQIGKGKKARIDFISANPTGPMHFGNARGGPIGDSLASVLEFSGWKVLREYLHNDIGGQVEKLGESILNVAQGAKLEDQEYKGDYVLDLVKEIGQVESASDAGKKAADIMLAKALEDAKAMGITFDKVYAESEFVQTGQTKKALAILEKKGVLKKQEGAVWFAPNDQFLKDRESVVVKSSGSYTYLANDIAYHKLKFVEGYDLVIDVFGANHHGHVPRLKAAVAALSFDASKLHVILYQWVRFKRGKEVVKMAKRAGTFVTAREVLDEVGKDALRFFILMYDSNSHIDFDLDLAKEHSSKNPVYYVQYAYARIASILTKVGARGPVNKNFKFQISNFKLNAVTPRYQLLTTNYELDLIKQITRLPELVEDIAQTFAVHRLTTYAIDLADSFHRFYENCPIITAKDDLKNARLGLICACQIVLANTLKLLGVSAPEKM